MVGMKIVFCHHFSLSYVGGGEKFVVEVARLLRNRGYDVEVRSLPLYRRRRIESIADLKYYEKFFHSFEADVAYFVYAPLVWCFFRTDAPKIAGFHAPVLAPELQASEIIPSDPVKMIRYHGVLPSMAYYYFKFFKNRDTKHFNAIHILNPAIEFNHSRVFYIPLFVDTEFYKPLAPKHARPRIIFVGRPLYKKGFDLFVKAAEIIHRIKPEVEFLATGIKGSIHSVTGVGIVNESELPRLYSSAWAVVYPSRIDVFPKVILEALSCETPVITTPIKAHTAINLPLIYASTAEEIAKKILHICSKSEGELIELGKYCRREVSRRYDVKIVLPMFENMLKEVAHVHSK